MNIENKKIEINLTFNRGDDRPEEGIFESSVELPSYLDELVMWAVEREEFNESLDDFVKIPGHQINICGSRRALFEFGKYLIALSKFDTEDNRYHNHLEGITAPEGYEECELLVHGPTRMEFNED